MRYLKKIFCFILCAVLMLPLAACKNGMTPPTGFDIDEDNLLTWEEVETARSYRVEIKSVASGETKENTTRRTEYDLGDLAEGDYEIRVLSLGGSAGDLASDWSDIVYFHKDYESGLKYGLINNNTEYEVSRVGAAEGDVIIEDTYRGKPVTAIGDAAFRASNRVTSIVVGNNVRSIGASAFYNCARLTSIVIPENVTSIGISAFQNCTALTSVTLPSTITYLPEYAFAYCRALTSFDFSHITEIGASAFSNCTALAAADLSAVTVIGEYAFNENDALAEVTFGDSLTQIGNFAFTETDALTTLNFPEKMGDGVDFRIGDCAFYECGSLERAALPEGATRIGDACFAGGENFKEISIPSTVDTVGQSAFARTKLYTSQENEDYIYADKWVISISEEKYTSLEKLDKTELREDTVGIADYAFIKRNEDGEYWGCRALTSIEELPASLTYIGKYAFYKTPNLGRFFSTGTSLKKISDNAFTSCSVLLNLWLNEGLTRIGSYAFSGTNVMNASNPHRLVPASVESIGTYAFYDTSLWNSPSDSGVIYAGNWVVGFTGNESMPRLKDGDIEGIADYAFYEATGIMSVLGLNRTDHIGVGAFYGCVNLSSVTFDPNLTEIPNYAFYNCPNLYEVSFPRRLKSIGNYSFAWCSGLTSVRLDTTSVETIGAHAFYSCQAVKTLTLGSSLTTIGDDAFYKLGISELTVPDSVTYIGARAFAKCLQLRDLTLGDSVQYIGFSAFRVTSIEEIEIPDSVVYIGDCAFYQIIGCKRLTLGGGVKYIGAYAFGRIDATHLVIPAGIEEIGQYAFAGCTALTSVVFLGEIGEVGTHAFYLCPSLTFYFKEGVDVFSGGWNSFFRPVVTGCTVSETGDVLSVGTGVKYGNAVGGIGVRKYEDLNFVGWAEEAGGAAKYSNAEFAELPAGKVLYPVYEAVASDPSETIE